MRGFAGSPERADEVAHVELLGSFMAHLGLAGISGCNDCNYRTVLLVFNCRR